MAGTSTPAGNHGIEDQKGTIQDATFITSDPGHTSADKPRRDDAKT